MDGWLLSVLGALFLLVLGSYAYSFKLSQRIDSIISNDLDHISQDFKSVGSRIDKLGDRVDSMEDRMDAEEK